MDTLLLDRTAWDLCIDARGNIAMASSAYAIEQDVCSAVKLVTGELFYGPAGRGIAYFSEGLGVAYPTQLLKAQMVAAAQAVPGVVSANVFFSKVARRKISGQVQIKTDGGTLVVSL